MSFRSPVKPATFGWKSPSQLSCQWAKPPTWSRYQILLLWFDEFSSRWVRLWLRALWLVKLYRFCTSDSNTVLQRIPLSFFFLSLFNLQGHVHSAKLEELHPSLYCPSISYSGLHWNPGTFWKMEERPLISTSVQSQQTPCGSCGAAQ